MKNLMGIIFFVSLAGSIILLFVSFCNFLIGFQLTGENIKEAYANNLYVSYWVQLLVFFLIVTLISFLIGLLTRRKSADDGMYVYEEPQVPGDGIADEYVTVRMKKEELSKLQL